MRHFASDSFRYFSCLELARQGSYPDAQCAYGEGEHKQYLYRWNHQACE